MSMRTANWSKYIVAIILHITTKLLNSAAPPTVRRPHMKRMAPLDAWAPSAASRVAIAGCAEGLGRHNLFPLARFPELLWLQAVARRGSAMSVGNIGRKLVRKFAKSLGSAKI